MLSVYPHGSGSLYTATYATTSSYASSVKYIRYVMSASLAQQVLYPESGSTGKSVCILTTEQYKTLVATGKYETCKFS